MNKKSIPGWTVHIEVISNGVLKVTLTDGYGQKTEIIDDATAETIEIAIGNAFDIEKRISKNWNLFLYDLAVQELSDTDIRSKEYNDKAIGSWFIERQGKRLIYDGRDSWLVFQTKSEGDWTDMDTIGKDDLKYSNFVRQIIRLI